MDVETLNSWSMSLTALGLAILWQSALLAGLVAGVCWLLRRRAPAIRYWCWQILALKLLVMPWWILAIPRPGFFDAAPALEPSRPISPERATPTNASGSSPENAGVQPAAGEIASEARAGLSWLAVLRQLTWHSWLVLIWLGAIGVQIGQVVLQHRRLHRLVNRATAATEQSLLALVDDVARQLGLRRPPAVVFTEVAASPFVCGMMRPVLVLPRELWAALEEQARREVVSHELAHIKRGDLLWGWIPEIARMIYFFHPVAHWICARIRLERELACDQLAMALSGRSAADYAQVLVHVVSQSSLPAVLGPAETRA